MFIRWPQGERSVEVMEKYEQNNGLPRCLGVLDGTHIPIKAHREHPEQYINRKNFHHAIQLQADCNCDRFFRDVYYAFVHDARLLRNPPLHKACENNETEMFPGDLCIIDDTAYPPKT